MLIMSYAKKDEFFGSLNSAVDSLGIASQQIARLWQDGDLRLRKHDLERIKDHLHTIQKLSLSIDVKQKSFEGIISYEPITNTLEVCAGAKN